jgi:nitrogen fixation protein NifU and related proteins
VNEALALLGPADDAGEKTDIGIDVGEGAGIHGQEVQRMLQESRDGLAAIGHRADDQSWPKRKNTVDGLHVPAIAKLGQAANGRNVGAPFGDADEMLLSADRAENRSSAGSERNDAMSWMDGVAGHGIMTIVSNATREVATDRFGLCDTFPMFSDAVVDHFSHPRNAGRLSNADFTVEASNPVCGDVMELSVRMDGDRIAEIGFLCRGCTTAIACGSLLTTVVSGHPLDECRSVTAESLSAALGELPAATFHGAQLAEDALVALLQKHANSKA